MSAVGQVEITGVGMHPFGRFPEKSLKDMVREAAGRALVDAGLGIHDIDAVYCSNGMAGMLQGQEQVRGQSALRDIGIERVPIVNIDNACAGGSSALREATIAVRAGVADTVLVVGFEKMFVEDRDRTLAALETAADIELTGGLGLQFTAVYAMRLRKRIDAGLLTEQDLVDVTIKSHRNGSLNPNAQHRTEVTAEQVRGSRRIADPLTLLMCSSFSTAPLRSSYGEQAREWTAARTSGSGPPSASPATRQVPRRTTCPRLRPTPRRRPTRVPDSAPRTSTSQSATTRWRPASCSITSSSGFASPARPGSCCAPAPPRSAAAWR